MAGRNGGKLDPISCDAVAFELACDILPEARGGGFRPHEEKTRSLDAPHHRGPEREQLLRVFVRIVHGSESQHAPPLLWQRALDRLVVKADRTQSDPAFRHLQRLLDEERRIIRLEIGIDQNIVDRLDAGGVWVAEPAHLHWRRAIGHYFEAIVAG